MVTKKLLISRLKTKTNNKYSIEELTNIVETYGNLVVEALSNGEEITFPRLGKFYVKAIKGKNIKNCGIPKLKGQTYTVANSFKVGFRSSQEVDENIKMSLSTLLKK